MGNQPVYIWASQSGIKIGYFKPSCGSQVFEYLGCPITTERQPSMGLKLQHSLVMAIA